MSDVTVRFVGSGDSFGSGGRLQTCILVDGPGVRFAMDFGTTSMVGLRALNIEPNSVDAILLSHLHGDHCAGVPFLMMDAMLGSKRKAPLSIIGPKSTQSHLDKAREILFPGSHVMEPRFPVTYTEINPGDGMSLNGLSITTVETRHTKETNPMAFRVEVGEKVVCYTGDGEYTDALGALLEDADLVVAECYFYDKPVNWHLNYPDIHRIKAKRVVLTHMSENMLAQTENVPEECAYDGLKIVV